jgi:hypothetical protein
LARLGVFLIPPPEHPFYQVTTGILGYDIWERRCLTSSLAGHLDAATLEGWLGRATTYGIHCTITGGDIFYDDADAGEIRERLAWIAGRTAPFSLVNGRFFDDFHARPTALVTTFDSPGGAIDRLHRQAATLISPLHVSTRCRPPRPEDDDQTRLLYTRTGETHALERFSPHWSLLTSLPDDASWQAARELVARHTGLFADEQARTLEVRDVQLVTFDEDGYCNIAASFPLTGND